MGILTTSYDLSGRADKDIKAQEVIFASDNADFELREIKRRLEAAQAQEEEAQAQAQPHGAAAGSGANPASQDAANDQASMHVDELEASMHESCAPDARPPVMKWCSGPLGYCVLHNIRMAGTRDKGSMHWMPSGHSRDLW